jgi:hypothetical protein
MNLARLSQLIITISVGGTSLLAAGTMAGCSGSAAPYSPSVSNAPMVNRSVDNGDAIVWSRNLRRVRLPNVGCFKAAYPAVAWSRIACSTPPHIVFSLPRRSGIKPAFVGNGDDLMRAELTTWAASETTLYFHYRLHAE